jgi:Zinc carboxypeptidase
MSNSNIMMNRLLVGLVSCAAVISPAAAQPFMPSKVDVAFNRYYTHEQLNDLMRKIAKAYPKLVKLETIGQSRQGRDMLVAVVTSSKNGSDRDKPAMWIDGNVHGNEIQAGEAVLYTLWHATKEYGHNEKLTDLLDHTALYLLPSQNPDGRAYWFSHPNNPHSSRTNQRPVDNDGDGLFDEDTYDDLDGDGTITQMWKRDPNGRWRRNIDDPRIFERAPASKKGGWTLLGWEGIDNDGDGNINEDPPGGDDMNRNWPSDWQPTHIQRGAGEYPFSNPETSAIGMFILDHPNIAAVQSFHNSGGMILRGPGADYKGSSYPSRDVRVYNEMGRVGEDLLPYYNYYVIWKDLYTVHGGFVNWTAEGLGVFSFTNELWTLGKYFQEDNDRPDAEKMWRFRDLLQFGKDFTRYTEVEHPQYGTVLVGGLNKWSSRNTPTFMLEESSHRNFGFTMFHAEQMPRLSFDRVEVKNIRDGLWSVTVEIRNSHLIPTRSGLASKEKIGRNDLFVCDPADGASVVAAGRLDSWLDRTMDEERHEPGRLQIKDGVPSRGGVICRFIVAGDEGDAVTLRYQAEKAMDIERSVRLEETP